MYKIRILNRAWLKQGIYGEYETREEAKAQMLEWTAESDADEWDMSGSWWFGYVYVDDEKHCVLDMELIEPDTDESEA